MQDALDMFEMVELYSREPDRAGRPALAIGERYRVEGLGLATLKGKAESVEIHSAICGRPLAVNAPPRPPTG